MGKIQENDARLQQLVSMARIGWWEVDFDEGVYYCSEFVADLLGIEGNKISAKDFANLICENYRERILEEFRSFRMMEIYEQVFPIHSKYGMMWVSTKVGEKRITKEGHVRVMGMLQCISRQRMNMQEQTVDRLNSLLSRLNGISKSLLDFLHSDDITLVINKILKEVLRQFQADRTYIFELDRKLHTEVCTYEIAVEGIKERKVLLSESSIDYASWWTGQILAGDPIILFTLNLLPDSAGADKRRLEEYGVKSTMVVPLNSKDGVWGYIGVDMVREHRNWCNEDYQWFVSLGNIISICMELRRSESEARLEKAYLQNIYKNLPAGIELYDKDGFMTDLNDKEMEIFGLRHKEDVIGLNLFDNPLLPQGLKDKLKAGAPIDMSFNYDFDRLDGYYSTSRTGTISLISKFAPLYDALGNLINILLINIDNTETTNAYSKIQDFEEFFTLIGNYAKVGYAHFNALKCDGYAVNSWYRNIGEKEGTPLNEIIKVHSHFHPDDRRMMLRFFDQVLIREASHLRRDVRILREDGTYTWTRVNVMVRDFRPEDGIIDMVCVNYDITELKETERKLIAARDKAEELDRLKSAFLANMSHEIRTPLNAIVGFSRIIAESENTEERKEYYNIVEANNERLLQLINEILDLSKIEAGTLEYVRQPMNLGEVCRNIYQIHKDRVQEGVTLILDNEDDDLIIEEDRNRIAQVITNFLTNAGKFTLSGEIRFGFKVNNQCIRFYVKDTGIGIAPDKVGHIFDRFVKLNSFAQGTGLGLAICRMIIEKIGGEIGATSEVGKGSTFFFTIPYKESSDDRITYSDTSEAKYLSHTIKRMQKIKKILVAEDVDSNFVLIKNMIGKDYTLLWAKDGFEAVEMYKQFQPDLILMDIKMPRMGGLEATRIIRSYSKEIPVIALTAYAFEADKEQALEAGCNDFVTKPVSKAALEEALGKCSG